MDIHELAALVGLSPRTINQFVWLGRIDPPSPRRSRWSRYSRKHLEQLRAYLALKHNNANLKEIDAILREDGIDLVEYVRRREAAIKAHGLGVA